MGISKHRILIEFTHGDYSFKMVDEWSSGVALYINGIEIARNKRLFAIPFISINRIKGKFLDDSGRTVKVLVETPHTPFATTIVYFDGVEVFSKLNVGLKCGI